MRVEILCTGDELLDGSVVDTNSAYFEQKAFALGALISRKETLPDDLQAIAQILRELGSRADFVLCSGGLGPTSDDVTAEAAALAAGVPLEFDQDVLARMKERFATRGIAFTENNARQARFPRGATVVPNRFGTAPMFVLRIGRADVHFLPGVPREFKGLCDEEVLPRLERSLAKDPARVHRAFRALKAYGIPESHLDALVKELPTRHPHVRFGFRTHAPENHLKLLAEGGSAAEAKQRLAAVEQAARALMGERCFGADSDEFAAAVLTALRNAKATIALAESCTGGLCASLLTAIPGSSEQLVSSAVVYQELGKTQLLGVDAALLKQYGTVSKIITRELALAAQRLASATFGAAVTGWAGPGGGTPQDPVGTVYVCLTDGEKLVEERYSFVGERERVRSFAAYQLLDLLRLNAGGLP